MRAARPRVARGPRTDRAARRTLRGATAATGGVLVALLVSACAGGGADASGSASTPPGVGASAPSGGSASARVSSAPPADSSLPALPYAFTGPGDVQGAAARARSLVYVPNQYSGTVEVIDPATYKIVDRFRVGRSPEHVVPNHDMTTLWVNSDTGNSMTPIDPTTGKPGATIPIEDPYNLYFTPDGSAALVMAERLRRIDVRDPRTMALVRSLPVPCKGLNHADYSADLSTLVASCEFSGKMLVFDANATQVKKVIDLNGIQTPGATSPQAARSGGGPKAGLAAGASAMPQDVRLSPDGKWFLAADMLRNGVWVINAQTLTYDRFIQTGLGAHAIYPSRDAKSLYVSNRDEGTISVLDATTFAPIGRWQIPGGGSPDMGGVTVDGKELWLTGRYSSAVYVFDTATGQLKQRIRVDAGPHGLLVWPQPGRFSLGHTGNMR